MRKESLAALSASILVLLGFAGCASWHGGPAAEEEGACLATALVDSISPKLNEGALVWLGVRDDAGEQTGGADALDEHLLSALMRAGAGVASVDTLGRAWRATGALPADRWQAVDEPLAAGGRVHLAGAWAHLRLFVVDTRHGEVLASAAGRLPRASLEQLAERTQRRGGAAAAGGRIELRLQVLVTRTEGGITRQLDLEEGGQLLVGDRLQARMSVSSDCELYAFLYDSEGVRRDVLGSQFVYSERMQYGPGEDSWLVFPEADRVHSLYVIAARRLAEDRSELWEQMGELVEQGRVDRFVGLSLQDQLLAEYVRRDQAVDTTLVVQRGASGVRHGSDEEVVLADGTRLRLRPEIIQGQDALIRAISFVVQ